jgi:hypothetical protein
MTTPFRHPNTTQHCTALHCTALHCTALQKAEKLQSGLHFLMDRPPNKHTVFVEDEKEAEVSEQVLCHVYVPCSPPFPTTSLSTLSCPVPDGSTSPGLRPREPLRDGP